MYVHRYPCPRGNTFRPAVTRDALSATRTPRSLSFWQDPVPPPRPPLKHHSILPAQHHCLSVTPDTWAEKFESFERINSIRETNGNFDSCNSCKRLGTSRLHVLHESKFPFVLRIEFIRSRLSNFSAHVSGVSGNGLGWRQLSVGWPGNYRLDSVQFYVVEQTWCAQRWLSFLRLDRDLPRWRICRWCSMVKTPGQRDQESSWFTQQVGLWGYDVRTGKF